MKDPTPAEDQFAARLAALERAVSELSAARNLRSATIDEPGSLKVRTAAGMTLAYLGRLADGLMGVLLHRPSDGTLALSVDGGRVALWNSTDEVVATDAASSFGLARPYLGFSLGVLDSTKYGGANSAAWVPIETGYPPRTHPKLRVVGLARTDPGTTGEVRLTVNGTQIGPVQAVASDAFVTLVFEGSWRPAGSEAFLATDQVTIEARRTAGTGFVRFHASNAYGLQS